MEAFRDVMRNSRIISVPGREGERERGGGGGAYIFVPNSALGEANWEGGQWRHQKLPQSQ